MSVTDTKESYAADMEARQLAAAIEATADRLKAVRAGIGRVIFGQELVVEQTLISILAGGHVLLIGVPGLAKTRLVETLGIGLGLDAKRIQCTPDLMPADILGSEVLEEAGDGRRAFRFIPGPVFCQLLMADEINRASPRTQSALLQAMQEKRVSVAGADRPLPAPFHVLATQNPLEQEGTYPLPEAQLDRFLMQIDVGYPDLDAERRMVVETTGAREEHAAQVMDSAALIEAERLVRRIPIGENVIEGILMLVRAGRPDESDQAAVKRHVAWGPGPRASQALALAARARALLDGRFSPSLDDVVALAKPVLKHRMALSFAARADGVSLDRLIDELVSPPGLNRSVPSNPPPDSTPRTIARDPALGIAAEALGARLPALMIAAQRVAQTVSQGAHGRRRVGLGESFWQFRPYQSDDTIDRIDWRQSAKGDRLYIRETEWAAAQTVWLWRDFGPGMEYRSAARLPMKQERAELLLLALASLLVRGGERVALLGGRAPTTGRGAVDAILAGLGRDQPLAQIGRAVARHATLVLFGDFLAPIDEIAKGLDRVAAGGGVAGQLVQILDPAEADLTFTGRVRFREMAEDAAFDSDALVPRVEAIRPAYLDALRRQQDGLADLARTRGWEFLVHTTDRPPEEALRTLYSRLAIRGTDAEGRA